MNEWCCVIVFPLTNTYWFEVDDRAVGHHSVVSLYVHLTLIITSIC